MADVDEPTPEVNLAFELAEFATSRGHAAPLAGTDATPTPDEDAPTDTAEPAGVPTSGPLLWEVAELSTAGGHPRPLGGGGEDPENEEPGSNVAEVPEEEERAREEVPGTPSAPGGVSEEPEGGGEPSGVPLPVQAAFMGTPGI
jgi:hypothetical protein